MPDYGDEIDSDDQRASSHGPLRNRSSYTEKDGRRQDVPVEDLIEGEVEPPVFSTMDEIDGNQNANPLSGVLKAAAPRNEFGSRRTVACAMMDSALLMANISQLRLILSDGHRPQFYTALLCCVIASIVFQIIFAALIMLIWTRDCSTCSDQKPTDDRERLDSSNSSRSPPPVDRRTGPRHFSWASLGHSFTVHVSGKGKDDDGDVQQDVVTQRLHCASVLLVFVITVLNMFIAGLGLEQKHVAAA